MATITYYFNAYDIAGQEWDTDPENMVDGSIGAGDYATTAVNEQVQLLTANECAGVNLGSISKVEIRAYSAISGGAGQLYLRPKFGGADLGDQHLMNNYAEGWSNYFDITSDTNAPAWNAWTDIQNLDIVVSPHLNCFRSLLEHTWRSVCL